MIFGMVSNVWYTCAMTLTTHAIVGATVASLVPQYPVLGICAAFMSHFVLDAIPHLDYPITSASINPSVGAAMKFDKSFFVDFSRIGTDMLLGILVSLFVLLPTRSLLIVLFGAFAGMLPDPLQFVHAHFRHEPLNSLQHFHEWVHTNYHLENAKLLGVISQLSIIGVVAGFARLLI